MPALLSVLLLPITPNLFFLTIFFSSPQALASTTSEGLFCILKDLSTYSREVQIFLYLLLLMQLHITASDNIYTQAQDVFYNNITGLYGSLHFNATQIASTI